MQDLYDEDGYFICDNIGARVEPNGTISNIYFNQEYTALKRVGYKRGKGTLSNVDWDEDEEVIGIYGNYKMVDGERRGYSALGLIVWTPYPTWEGSKDWCFYFISWISKRHRIKSFFH